MNGRERSGSEEGKQREMMRNGSTNGRGVRKMKEKMNSENWMNG